MSTQNPTETKDDKYAAERAKYDADRYAAYLVGLVDLTNLFSEHPDAVPYSGLFIVRACKDRADVVIRARAISLDGWEDESTAGHFKLTRRVGPHEYCLSAPRQVNQTGAGLLDDLVGVTSERSES